MGFINCDYLLARSRDEERQLQFKNKATRENSTLGKIFAPKVFENPQTGSSIVPFDLTEIRNNIAQKTQQAVKKVLSFKAYDSPTKQASMTLTKKLKEDKIGFIKDINSLRDADPAMFAVGYQFMEFIGNIKKILEKDRFNFDDVQGLRNHIGSALTLMENNKALFEKYPSFSQLLQALSYQIKTQVEGMSILENMGDRALSWCKNPTTEIVSATTLADHADEIFHLMPAHDWDSSWHWIKWAICNLYEAFTALIDNLISGGNVYNSYATGNVDITYGHFLVGDKKIRMHIGAGLMNDPALSEAALQWGDLKGEVQIAHSLEFNEKEGEKSRLLKLNGVIDKINEDSTTPNAFFVGTTHDGKIAKGKGEFSNIVSVSDFHDKLKKEGLALQRKIKNIQSYKGFALPEQLLSPDEINDALEFSKKAMKAALFETNLNQHSTKKYNERLCSALLANFNTFLEIKILIKLGGMKKEGKISDATYSLVCKQCFDRGPLANATLLAFVKLIEKDELNAEDEKQILGLLAGRTIMGGGDRKMVKSRRQAFIDLFRIIGRNQSGFVQQLREFAGGKDAIQFVPSNGQAP